MNNIISRIPTLRDDERGKGAACLTYILLDDNGIISRTETLRDDGVL